MSHNNRLLRIAQISVYPPIYGGVSTHVKRLHRRLLAAGVLSTVFCQHVPDGIREEGIVPASFRPWPLAWVLTQAWRCRADILHFHLLGAWTPVLWLMTMLGKTIVITVHTQSIDSAWAGPSPLASPIGKRVLKHRRVFWVAVCESARTSLRALGIPDERISVISSYIPPIAHEVQAIALPDAIQHFRAQHYPLLTTYGWQLIFDDAGNDLHSFDLLIEMMRALTPEYPGIGLIICLPAIGNHEYFTELQRRVQVYGLTDGILFLTEPLEEACALWKVSDLYIRATTTDGGHAISVREALSLGVPVVASDASERPPAAVCFRSRDLADLIRAICQVLTQKDEKAESGDRLETAGSFSELLSFYSSLADIDGQQTRRPAYNRTEKSNL